MDTKKEQIERKLIELESAVESEPRHSISMGSPILDLTKTSVPEIESELCLYSGLVLLALGLILLFAHVRVGTGLLATFGIGGQGFGLLMIPLMIGIGWILYNAKSKMGWAIVAVTCLVIFFSILSGLIMTFPATSVLGLIFMLLPMALGGTLILKGVGGPQSVAENLKKEGLIK